MSYPLQLIILFGFGIIAESFLLIRSNFEKSDIYRLSVVFMMAAFITLVGIMDESRIADDIFSSSFLFYVSFSLIFAWLFHKKVLPRVNENMLLVWTMVFWYLYLTKFGDSWSLSSFFMVPTSVVLFAVFRKKPIRNIAGKVALYVWLLFILVFFGITQFRFSFLSFFFDEPATQNISLTNAFLTGMVFLYLVVHSAYILNLVPIPLSEEQKFKDRLQQVRNWALELGARYSDEQMRLFETVLIIFCFGGALLFNYRYRFISDDTIISAGILLFSFRIQSRSLPLIPASENNKLPI